MGTLIYQALKEKLYEIEEAIETPAESETDSDAVASLEQENKTYKELIDVRLTCQCLSGNHAL